MSSSILESNLTAVQSDGSTWTDVQVTDVLFTGSSFSSGAWSNVTLQNVQFENSLFCGVNVSDGIKLSGVVMKDCTVNGLNMNTDNDTAIISALKSSTNCSLSSVGIVHCFVSKEEDNYFVQYLFDFIITSMGFPGSIYAAVTVYYFQRSYLLCEY